MGVFALILPLVASLPTSQVLAAILIVTGILLGIVFRRQPTLLIAVFAVLAWASRPTFQIFDINIRAEQPVLGVLLVIVLVRYRDAAMATFRGAWLLGAGLALWIGANLASSLLVAPDRILSLRIVVWLVISIGAGWIVSVLVMRTAPDRDLRPVLVVAGVAQVGAALLALGTGVAFGTSWGGYAIEDGVAVFRAYGLAWEPNIFASGVGILLPLAIDRYSERGRSVDLAACALLALGVGMATTRAVWIAVLIGLAAYVVLLMLTSPEAMRARRTTSLTAAGTVMIGVILGIGLSLTATGTSDPLVAQLGRHPLFGGSPSTSPSASSPSASSPAAPSPSAPSPSAPSPVPVALPPEFTDTATLDFRLERVRVALIDLRASPIIGMGANSFGQRHLLPGTDQPDHLAMFPVSVLYDGGIIGLGGFGLFAAAFVRMLWQSVERRRITPFLASLIVMVVAYVSTDAIRFSQNWILMGVALGIVLRSQALQENAPE